MDPLETSQSPEVRDYVNEDGHDFCDSLIKPKELSQSTKVREAQAEDAAPSVSPNCKQHCLF